MSGKLRNMTAIYLFKGDKVLLLFRQGGSVVNNVWTGSAGGHFEEFELNDAKACVLRELNEELGLSGNDIHNLCLRYVALRRTNGEIRQNYYFFANLNENISDDLTSNEGKVRWFSLEEIGELEMPFTAKCVMEHYCEKGRFSDKLYVGATNETGVEFMELPES
ncbi:MAG: NUDIX hydrolase [Lachnospiraceae bacterium]|nr:NUDIX hydrolase [Lachnospiraceae bacterium]